MNNIAPELAIVKIDLAPRLVRESALGGKYHAIVRKVTHFRGVLHSNWVKSSFIVLKCMYKLLSKEKIKIN